MLDTREHLRSKLREAGLSLKDASLRIGRNHAYLQQFLERGSPAKLPEDAREALAPLLGLHPDELRERENQRAVSEFADKLPVSPRRGRAPASENIVYRDTPRDLPVLGGARCGDDGLFEFNGNSLDHVRRPPRLIGVPGAYALYADGDSMAPWREPGDLVLVHPHMPVKPGDYVVVQLHPAGEGLPSPAYIKRLVRRTASEIKLLQYNPKKELSIAMRKVMAIHKVLDWSELLSM